MHIVYISSKQLASISTINYIFFGIYIILIISFTLLPFFTIICNQYNKFGVIKLLKNTTQ